MSAPAYDDRIGTHQQVEDVRQTVVQALPEPVRVRVVTLVELAARYVAQELETQPLASDDGYAEHAGLARELVYQPEFLHELLSLLNAVRLEQVEADPPPSMNPRLRFALRRAVHEFRKAGPAPHGADTVDALAAEIVRESRELGGPRFLWAQAMLAHFRCHAALACHAAARLGVLPPAFMAHMDRLACESLEASAELIERHRLQAP